MKRKTAHNILLTVTCIAFWCLGVAIFSTDPHGVNSRGLLGGLAFVGIFFVLHTIARGGGPNAEKIGKHSVSDSRN